MIRPLSDADYDLIYSFCAQNAALNLFFLGNLEALGVESELCEFWGSFDGRGQINGERLNGGRLNGVLMRYMDGWNIADGPGCDYTGFGRIVDAHLAGAVRLQDNTRHTDSFQPFLRRYQAVRDTIEQLCELDQADFNPISKPWPARRATLEDFTALCRFYADAADMARSPLGVKRPLTDGRVFIVEVENQIVSSALTNAETKTLAMIGGVYTPPEHRGKGYAGAAMVALCGSLISSNLRPVLYYDTPAAGTIYQRLGFKNIGCWRSVRLAPVGL